MYKMTKISFSFRQKRNVRNYTIKTCAKFHSVCVITYPTKFLLQLARQEPGSGVLLLYPHSSRLPPFTWFLQPPYYTRVVVFLSRLPLTVQCSLFAPAGLLLLPRRRTRNQRRTGSRKWSPAEGSIGRVRAGSVSIRFTGEWHRALLRVPDGSTLTLRDPCRSVCWCSLII